MNLLSSLLKFTADTLGTLKTAVTNYGVRLGTAETKVTNMEAQLATAISAVTVDSEVQNIRVGDDNVTYTSAGEAVRTQFSDVKSALKTSTGNVSISNYTYESYINTAGSTADIDSPVLNKPTWKYQVIPCNVGDVFYITGTGGSSPRLWAFVDGTSGTVNITRQSGAGATAESLKLIAEAGEQALIINCEIASNNYVFKGEPLANTVKDNVDNIGFLSYIFKQSITYTDGKYINYSTGNQQTLAGSSATSQIAVFEGLTFKLEKYATVTSSDARGVAFYDSLGTFLSGVQLTGEDIIITVPDGAESMKFTIETSEKNNYKLILDSSYLFNNYHADIQSINSRLTDVEDDRSEITPSWNAGYYVNNVARNLTAFEGYNYSDLIELHKGEGIKVSNSYTTTATVVDMISKWTYAGTYLDSIQPYSSTGYSDSTLYIATDEIEYIRLCAYSDASHSLDKLKAYKYNAASTYLAESLATLEGMTIMPSLSMFERIGFCGDSYVKGQIYVNGTLSGDYPNLSWGANIGRMEGITADIFASSGADTETFQSRSTCLPALLASNNPCGLYVFCLGINDAAYVTLGTIEDITNYESYTDYPNTFYGNYGKIIEQVMAYSANSKIILMTPYHPNYNTRYVEPLTEISEHYGIAMIDTNHSDLCSSSSFVSNLDGGHPTSVQHSAMARDISNLIGNCLTDYYSYFKDYTGI